MQFAQIFFSILLLQASFTCLAQDTKSAKNPAAVQRSETAFLAAETALRKMHGHLIAARDLEFNTQFRIVDEGLGLTTTGNAKYILRKPNLLRVTVTLSQSKLTLISDGRILTILDQSKRRYRQVKAEDTILGNLYHASTVVGVQVRMIDFFTSIDYLASLGGNVRLKTLPLWQGGKKTCDGFNIQRHDDEWSLWLERTDLRLPCRLISKRKDGSALVTQTNTLAWKDNPIIPPDTFESVVPKGYKKD